MNKGRYIDELSPGDELTGDAFVVSSVEEINAGGYRFIAMILSDSSGFRKAAYHKLDMPSPSPLLLYHARLLRVYGAVQTKEKYRGQIKIETFEVIAEPADLTPYVPPPPEDHTAHQERFKALLKSINEPHLRQLLRTIFDPKNRMWARFKGAVAAQGKHHAYPGGLLEHSTEVAELCDRACAVLPGLRREFLVTCALLHDIGKLDEMEHGLGVGRYTESGTLVGHVFSGAFLIRTAADGIVGFPDVLKDAIVHMVLSHHGRPEYGAARVPARSEAHVLAECDMMSARVNECCQAAAEAKALALEGMFSARLRNGEHLHIGDIGIQELPSESLEPKQETLLGQSQVPGFTTRPKADPEAQMPAGGPASFRAVFQTTAFLPVRGRVAAGLPGSSATEDDEVREVVLPLGGADYLLHVTGESMIGAGILDGDLLFVRSEGPVKNGDIVVAHLAGEGEVVKRLQRHSEEGEAWLMSENPNPAYQPIRLDEETRIQGKVTGLLRDL